MQLVATPALRRVIQFERSGKSCAPLYTLLHSGTVSRVLAFSTAHGATFSAHDHRNRMRDRQGVVCAPRAVRCRMFVNDVQSSN